MDSRSRLVTLMKDIDTNMDCDDLESFIPISDRLVTEYSKLAKERQQSISDLIILILAEVLQPLARSKYGDVSDASIRQVLQDRSVEPEVKLEVEKTISIMKKWIANLELEDPQRDKLWQFCDLLPQIFTEFVVEGVSRFHLIPMEETPQIATVLADMAQEVSRARNNSRCPQGEEKVQAETEE